MILSGCTIVDDRLSWEEAYEIAQNSECTRIGNLTDQSFYNNNTKTWWITLETDNLTPGCSPACVVYENNLSAEVNWRCTGFNE